MAKIGEVTGVEYKINRDGDEKKMLLQVVLEDVEDIQTVEYIQRGGEQSPPVDGSRVVVLDIEQAYKIGIAFDDDTPPDENLAPGDKKFCSVLLTPGATEDDADTVTIQSIITLKINGEITIQAANGNKDVKQLAKIKLTNTGAIEINSTDTGGVSKATIKLLNDGKIEINGNADFAVAFDDLKTEFNKLNDAWNNFATAYVPGGPSSVGTPPNASTSGSDIDNAKIDTVKFP